MSQKFQGTTIGISVDGVTYTLLGEITGYAFEDGERSDIDVTHSTSSRKEYLTGLAEADSVSFDLNYELGTAGLILAKASKASDTPYFFEQTYASGTVQTYEGVVKSIPHSGGADDKLSGSVTIRITSDITEV